MDPVINDYVTNMNSAMSALVKKAVDYRIRPFNKAMLEESDKLIMQITTLLNCLVSNVNSIESILKDTQTVTTDLKNSIVIIDEKSDYIHSNKTGMLVYNDSKFAQSKQKKQAIKSLQPLKREKLSRTTFIKEYGLNLTASHINELSFEDSFKFFNGRLYCCLGNKNYAEVPYVNVIDNKTSNKTRSIRCRFGSKENCKKNNYGKVDCFFAHEGETMVKVGYPSRSNHIVDLGNISSLRIDLNHITIVDVRTLLMYGLNDLFIAMVWLEQHGIKNKVFNNLDIA